MIHLSKETKKSRREIRDRAVSHFGESGLGLDPMTPCVSCACFEGGGGFVTVDVLEENGGRVVDIKAKEWEYEAKRFLREV